MLITVGTIAINLLDDDDRNVIHIKAGGYERASLQAWHDLCKPGRVAIDVGAYTGLFSVIAAKRGAKVFAFEPMPANRWRLSINAAINKAKLIIHATALSDTKGTAELHYNPKVPLTTGASLEPGSPLHHDSINVRRMTLDEFAFTDVAAIKIDVEHHEPNVLRGAMRTIEKERPALLIETLDGHARNKCAELLPRYSVAAILDDRNTLFLPK